MAAYAALVSLMHIMDQIKLHPRPPISLDKQQVESLTEKVTFLQKFLEDYSHVGYSKEADAVESRIANAAYAAEDTIESHIVDQILAGSTSHDEKSSSVDFYKGLQKVIEEDMDSIKKEVMEIKEKMGVQDQLHRNFAISSASLRSPSTGQNSTMVGLDDVFYDLTDKLVGGQPDRQIIPIVGMGGIGKTTLARNIYANRIVVQHFDIVAWATISQEYRMGEILLKLLQEGGENLSQMNEHELGYKLYQSLCGRRYLIIIDDIWDIEVWDQLKFFFPDNNNGSRIILTTRLSKLAFQVANSRGIEMGFLDEDNSWNLFCNNVFGKDDCPPEIKEIGKKIVENCKGLPLSIIVIAGLLVKSEQTQQYWKHIEENLNSIVSLEDNERCLQILYTSYNSLPVHLKPCFLYMGIFPEDSEIHVSNLIMSWVAEGFLKPIDGESLEDVAEVYLKDLIDRNLIVLEECNSYGKIKLCKLHDILRELCLKEAQKHKFLYFLRGQSLNNPQGINTERRICILKSTLWEEYLPQVLHVLESASLARSLLWEFEEPLPSSCLRLLRVFATGIDDLYGEQETDCEYFLEAIFQLVNLRFLYVNIHLELFRFPSSFSLLWNLQTLIFEGTTELRIIAPSEIWKMPQLRHVKFWKLELSDPPTDGQDDIVLENLQTLSKIRNFKCGEEVVKRIPNVKKLKIYYDKFKKRSPSYCLNNLDHLHKLESLGICCYCDPYGKSSHLLENLTFPHSLKKLILKGTHLHWGEMTTKIGSLPLLEVLELHENSVKGPHWETVEEQFCKLKLLRIKECDLEYWTTDSSHIPCLKCLVLKNLRKLKEIPLCIGDIPTLQSIHLEGCSDSAGDSAKRILEEQKELENVDLQVRVRSYGLEDREWSYASAIIRKICWSNDK